MFFSFFLSTAKRKARGRLAWVELKSVIFFLSLFSSSLPFFDWCQHDMTQSAAFAKRIRTYSRASLAGWKQNKTKTTKNGANNPLRKKKDVANPRAILANFFCKSNQSWWDLINFNWCRNLLRRDGSTRAKVYRVIDETQILIRLKVNGGNKVRANLFKFGCTPASILLAFLCLSDVRFFPM